MSTTVQQLAQLVGGQVIGDGNTPITGITNIESPGAGQIAFIQDAKRLKDLEASPIACLIVPPQITASSKPLIQSQLPKLAWAKILSYFYPAKPFSGKISDKASIAKTAKLGQNVTVEDFAVISDNAEIGDDSVVLSHSFIGADVKIGKKTVIYPHAMIYQECKIGNNVTIHAGTVIGADGFGYVATPQSQEKIPQVGNVIIEDEVEIGALTTIDRATLGSTVIGKGTKIDNQVQIAHNVQIGPYCAISAQTGISGSSKIGTHVTMGGKAGLGDHVEIGDWTMVGAGAGFPSGKKVPGKQIVFGQPARPYQEARRQIAAQLRAAEMLDDIRALRQKIAALEKEVEELKSRR